MRKVKVVVLVAVFAFALLTAWKVGASEIANIQFQEDLHDLSGQVGVRIGHYTPWTDDQFRAAVLRKAKDEGIVLQPEQVTVQRSQSGANETMYLAADYDKTITLPGYSFVLHFNPSSTKSAF